MVLSRSFSIFVVTTVLDLLSKKCSWDFRASFIEASISLDLKAIILDANLSCHVMMSWLPESELTASSLSPKSRNTNLCSSFDFKCFSRKLEDRRSSPIWFGIPFLSKVTNRRLTPCKIWSLRSLLRGSKQSESKHQRRFLSCYQWL